jgi:hypothetical protein
MAVPAFSSTDTTRPTGRIAGGRRAGAETEDGGVRTAARGVLVAAAGGFAACPVPAAARRGALEHAASARQSADGASSHDFFQRAAGDVRRGLTGNLRARRPAAGARRESARQGLRSGGNGGAEGKGGSEDSAGPPAGPGWPV